MRTSCRWIAFALLSAITLPAAGFAADEPQEGVQLAQADPTVAPAPTGPSAPTGVEDMVITARKREENLQDVPVAVTAFGEDQIEALGISDTNDISALAPNTYLTQTPGSAANAGWIIRGIGGAEPLLTRDTGVALYVDGAYLARTAGSIFDLVDLERVEVLRGPQGTLYGRNATGGAVNFITRKPDLEDFGFRQTLTYGDYNEWLTKTSLNTGEIGEGTGFGVLVTYLAKAREGYVDNSFADDGDDPGAYDTDAVRLAARWQPNEMFTADYSFERIDLDGRDPAFQLFAVSPTLLGALTTGRSILPFFVPGADGTLPPLNLDDDRMDDIDLDRAGLSSHKIYGHNLTLEGDLGFATLRSITTYRTWDNEEQGSDLDGHGGFDLVALDSTFTPGAVSGAQLFFATNEREQEQYSQELQLTGDIGEDFVYVAGGYYFREDFTEDNVQSFLFPFSPVAPPLALTIPFLYEGDAESWAFYGNLTWTPGFLDERFSLTVGARYSDDEKSVDQSSGANCPTSTPPGSACVAGANVPRDGSVGFTHADWLVEAAFELTDDVSTYARVATGYRSGGFNPRTGIDLSTDPTPASLDPFDEETLITYELGVKSQFWDNRITFNTAVFLSDYEDIQIDQFQAGSGGASSVTINAGNAEIWGAEAELTLELTDNLSAYANYGYLDPKFEEYEIFDPCAAAASLPACFGPFGVIPGLGAIVDVSDDAKFAYRPDNTFAGGVEYRSNPIGDSGIVLSGRVDTRFIDELYWHPIDFLPSGFPVTPFIEDIKEDGYWLFDASLSVSEIQLGERSTVRVTLWGRNLLDEEYLQSGIDFGALGLAGGIFGPPRTFGLTAVHEY